jgi:hypothetical protein
MALFKQINQNIYNYLVPYQSFAFTPSTSDVMFALRQYDSNSIPYLNTVTIQNYNYITGSNPQMMIGYIFYSGVPIKFSSDVFFFSSSYSGCPDGQFLYYIQLYQTLPYSCIACDSTCLQCGTSSASNPSLTNVNSCTSCMWPRYLNASTSGNGNCLCLPGTTEISGVCQ